MPRPFFPDPDDPRNDPRVTYVDTGDGAGEVIGPPEVMRKIAQRERDEMQAALDRAERETNAALDDDYSDLNDYDNL